MTSDTREDRALISATMREDFWLAASAFGSASAGRDREITYLDAYQALLAQEPKPDGRRRHHEKKLDNDEK